MGNVGYNQGTHLHHWRRLRQQDPLLTWPLFCPTDWVHLTSLTLTGSGKFIFKPALTITVLLEGGVPPVPRGPQALPRVSPMENSDLEDRLETAKFALEFSSTDFTDSDSTGAAGAVNSQGTDGTIEFSLSDTSQAPLAEPEPVSTVTGQVKLQGRAEANNVGTEITLFKDGVRVGTVFTTQADGSFSLNLTSGNYQLQATHPGWLSDTLNFSIGTSAQAVDLGATQLAAGDADSNEVVNSRDLQLFKREFGLPAMAGIFTDVNDNGVTDLVDTSYAGRNLGLTGLLAVEATP